MPGERPGGVGESVPRSSACRFLQPAEVKDLPDLVGADSKLASLQTTGDGRHTGPGCLQQPHQHVNHGDSIQSGRQVRVMDHWGRLRFRLPTDLLLSFSPSGIGCQIHDPSAYTSRPVNRTWTLC